MITSGARRSKVIQDQRQICGSGGGIILVTLGSSSVPRYICNGQNFSELQQLIDMLQFKYHGNRVSTSLGNSGLCWTVFARNRDTAVPAEENGDLQTLICILVARPRWCPTLSNPVPWQNWMAGYLGYTLRMKTLFRGWPVMVHDTHTRRRILGLSQRPLGTIIHSQNELSELLQGLCSRFLQTQPNKFPADIQ